RIDDLDAVLAPELVGGAGAGQLDADLAWRAGIVRRDGGQVCESAPGAILDQLAGAHRRNLPGAEAAEPALHRDRRQARPEQLAPLVADGLVAGDEQEGT